MNRAERKLWAAASTLEDLAGLTARWLEGELRSEPGFSGRPNGETDALIPILAQVNRAGFLTHDSQPGSDASPGFDGAIWAQRAAVAGWIAPEHAGELVAAARDAGLIVITHDAVLKRFAWPDFSGIDVSTREGRPTCGFGNRWRKRGIEFNFYECSDAAIDAVIGAVQIAIVDPEYGARDRLWQVLNWWSGIRIVETLDAPTQLG